jgi:predicted nuclease with TOPRIM domain
MVELLGAIDLGGAGVLAAAFLGAGGVSGLFNFLKINKERGQLDAKTDQIAADTLIKVNEELRRELARRDKEWGEEIQRRDEEIKRLRDRLAALREDFDALEAEFQKVTGPSS